MWLKEIPICLLLFAWSSAHHHFKSLKPMLAWKTLDYGFPSDNDRQYAIDNGLYVENTGTPIDVGVEYLRNGSKRIFVTIPRFDDGIPYTLATVTNQVGSNGPLINAYPNYKFHDANNSNCTGIISAFRVAIDECNHMWVIDSGIIGATQICPPQLLTFDLNTDSLIQRFQFPEDVYTPTASLLITPAVDILDPPPRGRCQRAMVYIADVDNPGLIVYDSQANTTWRIENKLMEPEQYWGNHTVAGESFVLMDGIFAVNLTPRTKKHGAKPPKRNLYFHALASDKEVSVPLSLINNQKIWQNNSRALPDAFKVLGRRGVQSPMEAMDSRGNLFANTNDPLTIFAWDIHNHNYSYKKFKIVVNNPKQLQFASGMKVVRNPHGQEELWVSTCRFQKIATGTLNPEEVNFRIMACKVDDLLRMRECRMQPLGNLL